jgi:O-antigen ligase/polysaccharide polymerase Wzy-like membrane protein
VCAATVFGGPGPGFAVFGICLAAALATRAVGDAATILIVFVVTLLLVPAALTLAAGGGVATPATLCGLVAAAFWILGRMPGAATPGVSIGTRLALLAFGAVVLVSYAMAVLEARVPVEARGADRGVVVAVALLGVALLASEMIPSRARLDAVLKAALIAGALVAVVAIVQFAFSYDVTQYVGIPGFSRLHTGYEAITRRAGFNRVSGTALWPIELSAALTMLIPIGLHFVFVTRRLRWVLVTIVITAAVPLSISRTGVIGLATVALVLFPAWPKEFRRRVAAATLSLVVAVSIAIPGLLTALYHLFSKAGKDNSVTAREKDWSVAAAYFDRRPWFGRGLGTFVPSRYRVFDNQYLLSLVEIGLIGTVAFVIVLFVGIGAARAVRRSSTNAGDRDLAQALIASIAVALVTCVTFDFLSFSLARGITFLLVGCAGALLRLQRAPKSREVEERATPVGVSPP